jgi:hypothetical protein
VATQYPFNHLAFTCQLSAFFSLTIFPLLQSLLVKLSPPHYSCVRLEHAFLVTQSARQSQELSAISLELCSSNQKLLFLEQMLTPDKQIAEYIVQTIKKLTAKIIGFSITHQLPKYLQVDKREF